jgi:tetratricopeptide (TPR) repeat protein
MKNLFLKLLFVAFFSLSSSLLFSQQKSLSELTLELKSAQKDSLKSDLNNKIARYYVAHSQYDSANYYAEIALELALKIKDNRMQYNVYATMASSGIYSSNYPKGIEFQLKALRVAESMKDTLSISKCYNNLGLAYGLIKDFNSSLSYYRKSLSISLSSNELLGKAYSNLGGLFLDQRQLDSALHYFELALATRLKGSDEDQLGSIYGNLGGVWGDKGDHKKSIEFFLLAIKIQEKTGDERGLTYNYGGLGVEYLAIKDFKQAELYLNKCYDLAKKNNTYDEIMRGCEYLAGLYNKTGDYKKAFEFKSKELMYKDSILTESNNEQIHKLQANYEFEKKQREIELAQTKVKAQEAEIKLQNTTKYFLIAGVVLFIFISFFMYNRFTVTRKQKSIIEQKEKETSAQKLLIEEKQKEIIDSIKYAKRIQQSLLPTEKYISKSIGNLKK